MKPSAFVLAFFAALVAAVDAPERAQGRSRTALLFGPLSSVHASALWLRYHAVLHAGDEERAYALARRALRADPGNAEGWTYLAYHYVFGRGSRTQTSSAEARRHWIEAGLDVLAEGRRQPGLDPRTRTELAFAEALYARTVAADAPWPGARAALLARADAALREGESRATGAGSAPGRIPRAAPR
ncbi:MAG: hypothetical protein AAFZ87_04195 [Planctomycetota bacterium]